MCGRTNGKTDDAQQAIRKGHLSIQLGTTLIIKTNNKSLNLFIDWSFLIISFI